ncbi:hypothetical protein FA13DRAFT_1720459 [Coprinellus micaceus]|uniref:Uncharacterized protein n=1 Tax=Coprinellus micaceus TaxID=71717 RepID=A0A4Y7S9L7_COPMI|nr:hypothetical protein FA13DRAFT_1720459 [Coprinellus micaceus]
MKGIVTAFKGEPVVYVFDGVHAYNTPLGSVLLPEAISQGTQARHRADVGTLRIQCIAAVCPTCAMRPGIIPRLLPGSLRRALQATSHQVPPPRLPMEIKAVQCATIHMIFRDDMATAREVEVYLDSQVNWSEQTSDLGTPSIKAQQVTSPRCCVLVYFSAEHPSRPKESITDPSPKCAKCKTLSGSSIIDLLRPAERDSEALKREGLKPNDLKAEQPPEDNGASSPAILGQRIRRAESVEQGLRRSP